MSDAQGRVTVLEVYRCDHPGCGKLFQTRGALHTHQVCLPAPTAARDRTPAHISRPQGWHKRRPKEGQTFLVHQVQKRQGVVMIETPRKRVRREGENPKHRPGLEKI